MSYIGNKPMTQAEKKTQQHTVTASKTVYPVSGGYSVGLIDVFLNGVLLLDNVDYSAGDGLNVTLLIATASDDTLVTVAWGSFSVADVVQPNDVRLTTAWARYTSSVGIVAPTAGYNISTVERVSEGEQVFTFVTPMDNADYSVVATINNNNNDANTTVYNITTTGFQVRTGTFGIGITNNLANNSLSVQVFGGKN